MTAENTALKILIEKIAKENNYKDPHIIVVPVSSGGANYSSNLFSITIRSNSKYDLGLFAKVAVSSEKFRDMFDPSKFYNIEGRYYEEISPIFRSLEDKHNIKQEDRLKVPKYYGSNFQECQETVVLENLAVQGYSIHNRFKSVDWKYASKAADELAKFHALAFAYEKEYPEECAKLYDSVKDNIVTDMTDKMQPLWSQLIANSLEVTKGKNREKVKKYIEERLTLDKFEEYMKPLRKPVLTHGDYRPSNLMHKTKDDGEIDLVIVDYQTLITGSPVVDLFYFIFNGTDEAFRKKHYKDLLQHYYNSLRMRMLKLNLNPESTYSKEDYEYDITHKLPTALAIGVYTLQVVTVEEADAPALDQNLEISHFAVKTSKVYAERFNGIINSFVDWGLL